MHKVFLKIFGGKYERKFRGTESSDWVITSTELEHYIKKQKQTDAVYDC